MPHFYIDISDRGTFIQDKAGSELPSFETACLEAVSALQELANHHLDASQHQAFSAQVRDSTGAEIYSATLTFQFNIASEEQTAKRVASVLI